MFEVRDLEHELRGRFSVARPRIHLTDVRLQIRNRGDDARENPLPIFHQNLELDLELRLPLARPLDGDLAIFVEHQVLDVRTARAVNRDAFSARDVTDDPLARQRIAALREIGHQIVVTFDLESCG